ncbi:conserved hypothetical protein [Altererythrobacter sp. B11]|uniref:hypothetical protein n=1 Tax=Altererythrobacter sp. B11 TaxID=2060312 RepID=UPI000DC6FB12|nr:hypothetical protein [Altererythrobacter sp. B11]BBC71149.1 conserved hypothetical protein [Altererythrobacter sp. B11]
MPLGEALLVIAAGLILLTAAAIWRSFRRQHTEQLRRRYGEEYARVLAAAASRSRGEPAASMRNSHPSAVRIRPVVPTEAASIQREWAEITNHFSHHPEEALRRADQLIGRIMTMRGFSTGDSRQRYEDLTVDHGVAAQLYRAAHDVVLRLERGAASQDDMRRAMQHYERVVDELLRADVRAAPSVPAPKGDRSQRGFSPRQAAARS